MEKSNAKKARPLTNRQLMFVSEYVADAKMNATLAAIRAGYSERTANEQAVRLMADERIQRAIQEEINARRERLRMSADDVLIWIMEALRVDIRNYVEWNEEGRAQFRPSDEVDGRFITKLSTKTRRFGHGSDEIREDETTVDLISKEKMVDLLFKHFGLNAPIKIDETVPFAQLVAGALEAVRNVSTDD